MTDHYAVIGNPIEHSKSPAIHKMFAEQTDEDIEYGRILGKDFEKDVKDFIDAGGRGLNVTVPFKEQAFQMATTLSDRAKTAEAVNTLLFKDGQSIEGDNTDGVGLVTDLGCNHLFNFAGSKILLLGAGGASKGVLRPLLEQAPVKLVVANRTASKAVALAEQVGAIGNVSGCGLDQLAGQRFDLIINGTAAGLTGDLPAIPDDCLETGGWTYDMMYSTEPTAFVRWGKNHQAGKALDGLGMLVEQAAESCYLWRNVRPDTSQDIADLR